LDTNVIVSGLRSISGISNQLLQRVALGEFSTAASTALIFEYEEVLSRPGMIPGFTDNEISEFLDDFCSVVSEAHISFRWRPFLPDPKDDLVFECALAAGATHIITSNLKDFQGVHPFGISVMTPFEFLRIINP
jgi:putative PIN family toxin of toxin-antitoxin system